ncbi:NhaP-type Na+/H+ or K+/H+ antiporter [Methanococcus voltae]|uniref:cation:proton antiporter n=1 Tax=Methanococcus voltae TaxID=2188 RepID=UPI001AE83CF7|nr:sodium:proton antiporter [Methanococcus voltae]MBP2143422.1 NhaP-type Na+/H+ or K+/H+ antiporter [Methanococcus voltae]
MDVPILIGYMALLFVFGSFLAKIAKKLGIPDIPVLLTFGLFVGPFLGIVSTVDAQTVFSFIGSAGLIVLLLMGAFEMRWIVLKRVLSTVIRLDTIGLIIYLVISGLLFNIIFGIPNLSPIGYLFGAVTSATDPATLIPIFANSDIDPNIAVTLEAESVFNDPLGIVATSLILTSLGFVSTANPIIEFFTLAVGGLGLGYLGGKVYEYIVRTRNFGEYISPLTMGIAFLIWYIGEEIIPSLTGYGFSGYMAVAIMGLYIGNVVTKNPAKTEELDNLAEFGNHLSVFIRVLIFVFLGASISLTVLKEYALLGSVCALAALFIARPIGVLISTAYPNVNTLKERAYFALEAPRGVVPAAMGAMIYSNIMANPSIIPSTITAYMPAEAIAGSILVTTFVTIFFSVIIEGSWAYRLANKLFNV